MSTIDHKQKLYDSFRATWQFLHLLNEFKQFPSYLHAAACYNKIALAHALLQRDYHAKNINSIQDEQGETALHYAVKYNSNSELVNLLVAHGADYNQASKFYYGTPLHYAARAANPETVKALLEKGADPYVKDIRGRTPLKEAQYGGNFSEDLHNSKPRKTTITILETAMLKGSNTATFFSSKAKPEAYSTTHLFHRSTAQSI